MDQRYSLLLFFILNLLSGCQKDVINPKVQDRCKSRINSSISYFKNVDIQLKFPFFNPNNPNEFLYYYVDLENDYTALCTFDLLGGNSTIIAENLDVLSQPKWSSSNWIAFSGDNYSMNCIKSNGDSLTNLNQPSANLYPTWANDGNELFWQHSPVLGHPYFFLKSNFPEIQIDTLITPEDENFGYVANSDISIKNDLAALTLINNTLSLAISHLDSLVFVNAMSLHPVRELSSLSGLSWAYDGSYIYFTAPPVYGLARLEPENGKVDEIIDYCWHRFYKDISTSSDGRFIIAEKVIREQDVDSLGNESFAIRQSSKIVLIKTNDFSQVELDLIPF